MNFKTLLLGSATAMIVAGGAHAADLTVAEPVDYVKVCDAFGAGFFYSPGTDTCIKIGGYVKFGTNVSNSNSYLGSGSFVSNNGGENFFFVGNRGDNSTHYGQFYTEASIQLTASSVTEYGNLTGWIDLRARTGSQYDYAAAGDSLGHIDSAYIELGPLKAGHFTSAFDYLGGYTDFGAFRADSSTDHIQLTYALGGFGIIASVEDGSDRLFPYATNFGLGGSYTTFSGLNSYTTNVNYNGSGRKSAPDLVAALTYATGPFSAKLSGAFTNSGAAKFGNFTEVDGATTPIVGGGYAYTANYSADIGTKSGYAVQLGLEVALDNISKGDKFGIQGVYADDAPAYTGWQKFYGAQTLLWDGTIYGGFASYIHYWNPSLWTAAEVSYLHHDSSDNIGSASLYQVSASTDWAIVKNLDLMLDGSYAHTDHDIDGDDAHQWSVNLWMKRSW